jgi:hypothetical protein
MVVDLTIRTIADGDLTLKKTLPAASISMSSFFTVGRRSCTNEIIDPKTDRRFLEQSVANKGRDRPHMISDRHKERALLTPPATDKN